ncbi:3-oxoacyl-[acyl-carrier-protein] synthase III C-terminal domain-containing protein, partial [Dermabacter hominis]
KHPDGHRIVHTQTRAGTEHHELCIGNMDDMRTDTAGLLENGLELVTQTWRAAEESGRNYSNKQWYITHQVSMVYTRAFAKAMGINPEIIPVTFPELGNIAAEAVPLTLALNQDRFAKGDELLLLGVGSGLNTAMMEVQW